MRKFTFTTLGALFTGALASLCCVGPLVLAGLGLAGVAGLTGLAGVGAGLAIFEPYRPYLTAMTALFLGAAFFMTYRRQDETCAEGEACAAPRTRRMQKMGLWTATGVIGLMLSVPYLPLSGTSSAPDAATADTEAGPALATTTLRITGMT